MSSASILLKNWRRGNSLGRTVISLHIGSDERMGKWTITIDGQFLTNDKEMETSSDASVEMVAPMRGWQNASRCGGCA